MSLLKTIRQQLGLSTTPANNFTLDASADNGTMKLARGNAGATTQDILTVDASGKVSFPQMAQTWQDVTASRALGTSYTNSTGQPIKVLVSAGSTSSSLLTPTVGGVVLASGTGVATGFTFSVYFDVPAGATYSVANYAGTPTLVKWTELR